MKTYRNYLLSRHIVKEKQIPYYVNWVTQCFAFHKKSPGMDITDKEIGVYLKKIEKQKEDWQVKQAHEAINLYLFLKNRLPTQSNNIQTHNSKQQWAYVVNEMKNVLRLSILNEIR